MIHEEARAPAAGWSAGAVARPGDRVLAALVVLDLLLFVGGATAHSGVAIPLGPVIWTEPFVWPARIVEGVGGAALAAALLAGFAGVAWRRRLAQVALWYCFAAVLWGNARLAMGSIPAARTASNDFLHIAMVAVTTLALVRLASRPR